MSTKLSLLEVDLDVPLRRIRDHQHASLTRFSELSRNLKFYHFIWWEITSLSIQINMKVQTEAERLWQNHDEHQAWTVFTSWIYFPTKLQFVYSWSIFDSRSSPHEDFSPVALCIHISIYIYIYCTIINDFLTDAGIYKAVYTASYRKRLNIYFPIVVLQYIITFDWAHNTRGCMKIECKTLVRKPELK